MDSPQHNQFVSQQAYNGFDPNAMFYHTQTAMSSPQDAPQEPASPTSPTSHHQVQRLRQLQQQAVYQQQQAALQQQMMSMYQQTPYDDEPLSPTKKTQSKEERRAEHNAIERKRRESLNTRFQQLAHLLPNLQNDRRPSKGTIIERTLEFVKHALQKEEGYKNQVRELQLSNRKLMDQMNVRSPSASSSASIEYDDEHLATPDFSDNLSYKSSCSSLAISTSSGPSCSPVAHSQLEYSPMTEQQQMMQQWGTHVPIHDGSNKMFKHCQTMPSFEHTGEALHDLHAPLQYPVMMAMPNDYLSVNKERNANRSMPTTPYDIKFEGALHA